MKRHTPLESRLARAGRRSDLRRLQDYAAPHAPSAWMPANDNEVASTQIDRVVEIRPSPDEMVWLAAKDAIRARGGYGPITAGESRHRGFFFDHSPNKLRRNFWRHARRRIQPPQPARSPGFGRLTILNT